MLGKSTPTETPQSCHEIDDKLQQSQGSWTAQVQIWNKAVAILGSWNKKVDEKSGKEIDQGVERGRGAQSKEEQVRVEQDAEQRAGGVRDILVDLVWIRSGGVA